MVGANTDTMDKAMAIDDAHTHLVGLAEFPDKGDARRWRALAGTKAGWRKCCAKLPHEFDPLPSFQIDCAKLNADAVLAKLRELGAPETVCCVGDGFEEEDAFMPLDEAVDDVFGNLAGELISCVSGKLAYFESGDQGVRMILRK